MQKVINNVKNKKALVIDGITNEILKYEKLEI